MAAPRNHPAMEPVPAKRAHRQGRDCLRIWPAATEPVLLSREDLSPGITPECTARNNVDITDYEEALFAATAGGEVFRAGRTKIR